MIKISFGRNKGNVMEKIRIDFRSALKDKNYQELDRKIRLTRNRFVDKRFTI